MKEDLFNLSINNTHQITTEEKFNGGIKIFDLVGFYNRSDGLIGVYIGAKNYSSSTGLMAQYKKFLIDSFSVWIIINPATIFFFSLNWN